MGARPAVAVLPDGSGPVQHSDAFPEADLRDGLDSFPADRDAMEIVDLTTADRPAVARQALRRASDLAVSQLGRARRRVHPDELVEL